MTGPSTFIMIAQLFFDLLNLNCFRDSSKVFSIWQTTTVSDILNECQSENSHWRCTVLIRTNSRHTWYPKCVIFSFLNIFPDIFDKVVFRGYHPHQLQLESLGLALFFKFMTQLIMTRQTTLSLHCCGGLVPQPCYLYLQISGSWRRERRWHSPLPTLLATLSHDLYLLITPDRQTVALRWWPSSHLSSSSAR